MSFLGWTAAVGALLLGMSLAAGWIRRLPMTHFAVYLAVGVVDGPWGLHLLDIDFLRGAHWLERLTEVALSVSLFVGGLKLRVPWHARPWRTALRLAFPAMLLSVAATTVVVHLLLPLGWPAALMLAAALAPTDPVLASTVAVDSAGDQDGLRVALSGEAGLNDGSAMPFLLLGIALWHAPLSWALLGHWAWLHVVWGMLGALGVGFGCGCAVGYLGTRLRVESRIQTPGALLSLGLIALTYAGAQAIGAIGFIAVFCAGLGMRLVEMREMRQHSTAPEKYDDPWRMPPAERLLGEHLARDMPRLEPPARAVGQVVADALTFGNVLEMLLAPFLVVLLGLAVANHWSIAGVWVMLPLFFVIRPATTWLATLGLGLDWRRRLLLGWLGLRGIGGLNYLAYALMHGLDGPQARVVAQVVVTVITLSVVLHGFSAQPLMRWRDRRLQRLAAAR